MTFEAAKFQPGDLPGAGISVATAHINCLVVWNMFYDFPFSWECHYPNWRNHIHPASRGVAAHTAGLFRSVRGAKGGVEYEEQSSTWGLPKRRNFHFSPVKFPKLRISLSPPGGGPPQAREFSLFHPVGASQAREFSLFPLWGLPKLGNFHFSPPWQLPKHGIFTFPSLGGSPSCGISNS